MKVKGTKLGPSKARYRQLPRRDVLQTPRVAGGGIRETDREERLDTAMRRQERHPTLEVIMETWSPDPPPGPIHRLIKRIIHNRRTKKMKIKNLSAGVLLALSPMLMARCGCGGGTPNNGCTSADIAVTREGAMNRGGTYDPVDHAWYDRNGVIGYAYNNVSTIWKTPKCAGF